MYKLDQEARSHTAIYEWYPPHYVIPIDYMGDLARELILYFVQLSSSFVVRVYGTLREITMLIKKIEVWTMTEGYLS